MYTVVGVIYLVVGYFAMRKLIDWAGHPMPVALFIAGIFFWPFFWFICAMVLGTTTIKPRR